MIRPLARLSLLSFALTLAPVVSAQTPAASFRDVPQSHPAFTAIEYLKAQGVLRGYEDGTFRPENKVNRAEAVKIIVAPLVAADALASFTASPFSDVPAGSWFLPYVEAARTQLSLIDGPPKAAAFNGQRTVNEAEFLKVFELSQKVDPAGTLAEITLPLATDVTSAQEWYYPYVRFGVFSSMLLVAPDGNLQPGRELTRAEVSLFLYRFLMFQQGRRTQALLSETESELNNVLTLLKQDTPQAEYASARALVAARGALMSKPDEPIVKAAVKTAEGFRAIVEAYKAGKAGDLQRTVELAGIAWSLAARAREFSPSLDTLALQMQTLAKNMADEARAGMGG